VRLTDIIRSYLSSKKQNLISIDMFMSNVYTDDDDD